MCGEALYRVNLSSLWLEAFLYGAYLLLFAGYIYTHINMHPNKHFLAPTVAMFALSTILMANDLVAVLLTPKETVNYQYRNDARYPCSSRFDDPYEDNVYNLTNLIQSVIFVVSQFVADMLLLYRCHVLWRYAKPFTLFPAVLVVATLAVGVSVIYYLLRAYYLLRSRNHDSSQTWPPTSWVVDNMMFGTLNGGQTALSIATNLLLTSMIVVRIWRMLREVDYNAGSSSTAKYKSIMATLVESGVIFTGSQLLNMVLTFLESSSQPIVACALNQIVGIMPTLIMVQVGLCRGIEQTIMVSTQGNLTHVAAPALNEEIEMVPPGIGEQRNSQNRHQTDIARGS